MIHVYLDDVRPCPPGFTIARSVDELLLILEECEVGVLSMDHDLGWDCPNGTDAARLMVERGLFPQEIFLHSSNPQGRMSMFQILYKNKPSDVQVHLFPVPERQLAAIASRNPPSSATL